MNSYALRLSEVARSLVPIAFVTIGFCEFPAASAESALDPPVRRHSKQRRANLCRRAQRISRILPGRGHVRQLRRTECWQSGRVVRTVRQPHGRTELGPTARH